MPHEKCEEIKGGKRADTCRVFDFVKERFETTDVRLGHIEQRIDTRAKSTNDRIDGIDARLGDVQRKVTKIESKIEDIQDDLASALNATDKDVVTILDHERRIRRLEKTHV